VVVVLVLMSIMGVRADDWPAPRVQNVFSSTGRYFVRIVPAAAITGVAGSAGTSNQVRAHGEFYMRLPDRSYRLVADVALRNRVSPTYAIVTDDEYVVTFDDWLQMGIGEVMAFYRPTGALIRAVTIEELYKPDKLMQIPRSISSRQWRCGVFYTSPTGVNDESLTVVEHFGGSFVLHATTGTFEYRGGTASCSPGDTSRFR
jgi:hypothetical protein